MRVDELTKNQLTELKANYLTQLDDSGELEEKTGLAELSYGALASVDDYVSDDFILEHCAGVDFSEDDFADEDKSKDESNDNEDEWCLRCSKSGHFPNGICDDCQEERLW